MPSATSLLVFFRSRYREIQVYLHSYIAGSTRTAVEPCTPLPHIPRRLPPTCRLVLLHYTHRSPTSLGPACRTAAIQQQQYILLHSLVPSAAPIGEDWAYPSSRTSSRAPNSVYPITTIQLTAPPKARTSILTTPSAIPIPASTPSGFPNICTQQRHNPTLAYHPATPPTHLTAVERRFSFEGRLSGGPRHFVVFGYCSFTLARPNRLKF